MEVNLYGASVDVRRIYFFIWYASRPGIPPKSSIFGRRRRICLTMRSKNSQTTRLQAVVRCCVTKTLASKTFDSTVKRVPKLRFETVSFLFLVCFSKDTRIFFVSNDHPRNVGKSPCSPHMCPKIVLKCFGSQIDISKRGCK